MDMSVALRVARRFITLPLDKRKLYLAKMQEEGVTPANLPIPEVASAFERIPLSYAQERQWFLWQMDPQSAAYNIPSALRLRGELDVEALSASLGAIVERHQSLRTVFVEDEQLDGFRQQVLASVDVPVPVTLAGDDDAQAQIRAFVESETQQPFDLRNGPLLRARLLRLAADDHVLTLTIHHVAADGWSMRVLVEELIALYGARRQGVEATLPDLPIQYADYAIWQRHWLEAGERERQLEYWMARLGGGQSVLELPTDRQRPALPSYRGARHELQLPQALGRQLQALAQREGTTLFMLLLASFQALLHRYSGQDEIRVGVPVANRNRVETERLIGFFVNTQVLRADLDAQMPFLDLLQQTRVAALGAQSHQDLPFEQLVEALQPERSLSHSPLFQAMYNHQNLGSAGRQSLAAQLPGLSVEDLSWGAHSAQFDLTLDTYESEQGVHAEFTYATDLFEAATVERLARHWRNLLEAVVAEPRRRLGDLSLLDAEERATLLQRSRLPASEYPAGQGVHRLFEAQAGLTPDAPALLFGEERLSYAELNALANRLAWRLREEGVGSDVLVGIALERGVPMVVALLAVLKAGGAYVPLDPQYPADRLQYMIDDSGLRLLLSQQSVLARLPQSDGLQSLLLDDLERLVHGYPAENPDLPEAPDSLCYAIYTSGSTGQPKGVMVRHRALTNFVCSIARQPGMLARDRLLSVTTFSFDIFGLELYVPLARGASMLLASREQAQDPEALLDLVERQGVTVLQATPATWRMLCDSERVDLLRGCTLLCGGEALAEDLAARMRGLSASTWNLYGPTETTIWSARFRLGEEARPFLGGPLENTALYILDSEMNPCPPGVAGELLIGGDGLARGYHRRPGLTAERFLPDPFAADGSRLYRTGDLARYRADGVIEYLGRIDHQVKIRGFRIELGEIETRLLEQDSVREAVVVAQPGVAGPSLVAYLVPTEAALVDAESARQQELRSALKNSLLAVLPDYMVPAHMLLLENLPLTPNGKINRKALPLPDASAVRDAHVAPEGELERAMAAIWSEVLKLGHIGRDDNFFELGGHSLLVTQVVSRVRRRLDLQVPLRTLFEHSTLRAYAQAVAQLAPAAQGGIVRCARDASPQLSFAQERQWFIWRLDPHSAAYNIPVALRLKGPLRRDALQGALDLLVQRHETLRTTFVEHDGAPRQVIHPTLPIAIEERRPPVAGEDLKGLVETEAHRPFDLQRGPLLRVLLLPLATDECVLVLTLHHIIADGWSMQVLVDELIRVYAALRHDEPPALAELPIQYADFAAWQRQWMDGGERERQLGYWVSRLGGEQPLLELPSDRPRPQQQSHRGRRIGIPLPAELAEALRRLAQAEQGTLFMLLLASFQALLHRYSGQNDIRVGVPIANRNREETEGLIGFFVNTQVLCAELDGQLPFRELLRQVRRAVVEAQGHQDLPFEQLVDALQPERSLSHAPLFQVMYNHQRDDHRGSRFASLGELEVEDLAWDVQTAQFDLTLDTYESSNGLLAELTYATDLFDASSAERIAGHWLNLLRSIVARPEARIAELKLLDEAEARADLLQWNPHPQDFPPASCLHRLIERQAAERPRATAVVYGERALDYGELNLRANRLAHRLIELGVGPDVLVGLAAERSLEMIVGLLAILKAGGAYVPLDPRYPSDRLGYMIEDSGIRLLLTQRAARERLPLGEGLPCLLLDAEHEWAGYPESDPQSAVGVDNLAYVIYTSGSTGKPKGTLLPHGNVLRLFDATRHWFGFSADDAWSLFHSYAFDFSVWEIFGALLHGGRLVIVPYETSRSPEDFLRLLCRERVTVLNQTPSAFKQLMQVACAGQEVPPLALRHVVFGGEALEVQALRPWFERFGDRAPRLVNMYGITETTVHVTYRPLSLADLDGGAASPIGEPIPDLSWYLLDAGLNPVPRGCIGELYVGGAGLARGYLNRPELSCTRFVADPFSTTGGRLYRTGDLARYRCDGVVEYVGRIDHQVKIRGFRIELGEIEARLLTQPGVAEAVVLPHEGPGATQLVGYVVTQAAPSDPAALRDTLRQALKASLPEHMVPAHLLFLERLPLTANGKLDRRALPAPDASRLQRDYTAPRSELEQRLAAIWADVLKLGRVGLDDNFFELGGDSIISIQVVSRARQAGIRLAPRDLFLHQTIRGLAGVAVEGRGLACAEQGPISGSTPLLPIQQMFFELDIPRRQHWNQSVLLEPGQALDGTLLETALQALLAHHDALRLGFRLEDGTWRAEHRAVEAGEVLLWQQSVADGQALEALAEQVQRSLDLGSGPLLRALLATLGDGSQRLLLVIHHLVVDGVSWRILLEDLQTAYRQLQSGQAVALPAKTSAFKAWAERLQAHARDGGLEGERAYWLAQLEGVSTELPCDDREGAQSVRHVRSARTELTEEATRRLLQEAPAAYRTQVNDLLLTALARVIGRWTGQADTLIQLEGHGREELFEDIDLTRTVGWFTSLFPLRLSPVAELGASIKRIKEQLRAIPHKGLGFGALRYLGSAEDRAALAALPSPRITFNYLGQFDGSFSADSSALFRPSADAAGSERDSDAPLDNWLSLNGQVYAGRLGIDWSFSAARFSEASILRLADAYRDELLALIEHCCAADVEGVTPSDFPLAGLDQRQLDALPLAAGEVEDLYPLSPMQQGMLFHSLYQQNSGDYINQMRLDVEGLDPQRFREAWQAALDAHEVLRSGFLWQGALEKPLQLVRKRVEVPFSVHDWRDRADLAEALDALAAGEAGLGFELAEAPLLRLVLVRTGERRHHLIYTNHHILMDGWSNSQLLGEVLQRYRGETPSRSDGRYRDYIAWLQRQDAGRTEAFWKQRLQRLGEPTLLVPAFAHGVRGAEGHADRYRQLDVTTSQRLAEFAREQKVTLNTLVQAAWLILLQRFTGQDTVAFGATVSGRPAELRGIEEQIGLFINTLPVVASPCPEQPIGDWLQAVQGENLALREFEHTPLYDIQRWAGQVGEALFDNILVFENYPVSAALAEETPADMRIDALSNQEQTHYPLTLLVSAGETLELHYSYSRQAFDEAAIECLAERLERLLLGMCENPGASLGELDSLAVAERYQLLEGWNATAAQYPLQRGVHRLFEEQVERTPTAPALAFGEERLDYVELNRRANRLAHGRQLVGYVVLESEGGDWREALAAHLAASLPEYMVPAQWLALERMPLSPNGKLDRKALPKIEAEDGLGEYVAPASEPERQLAAIWADVLGRERVGVTDNFFALGGDSIVSIQVVSRARQAGLQLSPRDLFQLQNIRKLAERCSAAAPVAEPASVPDGAVLHNLLPQQVQALPLPHERLEHLYSLSPMQQGMLFLGLNSPDAELYINQLSIAVDGLDPQRLQRAWSAVAQRHEVLRSGFLWLDQEEPLQFVLADPGLPFEVLDWRGRAISDEALEQVAQQERRKGFDLGQPPLQRIRLLRLGEDRYQLIWTYHHILIDGWSTSQLFGEILELYSGGSLPPAVPYRHYIAWLRARDGKASEAFWRRQLARMDEPTYLADAFNAAREGYGHQALYTRLDSDATEHLKRFAQSQRVTLNTLVQGAWLLLLSRYSGQRCVSFGATVAGRPASLEASERILGLFINTLPVVCEVAPEQCVGDWLRALQDYNLEMREQEYTPLSDIQRWAGRSGQSLFDSIIVFENHPVDRTLRDWRDDSLRFGEMRSAGLTNFPMDLMVTSDDSGLAIEYMFLREHFAVASVERLRTDMEGLLAALSGDAECRLGNIGLPSARVPLADGACPDRYPLVHQRIGEWSRRTPDATALVFDERSHSFAELDARANRLAHALVERGVAADVRVGVALPRGTELVVALLAVLKAGGAYVPLDLAYPRERLAYLMQDSGIALLLSESQALVQLPVPAGVPALALDRLDLLEHPAQAPQVEVHPANLAYVIYTSGSTGLPKGVAVSHGPLAMHIDAVGERYEMTPADRELHFMSFAFDGAHERWLTALGHGGSLLLRDDALWTPEQTYAAMQRHGVTVAAFPPVYLQQLAEHAERDGNPPPVRIYCFGGDAVPVAGFELAKRALKPRYIINGYGPTETVVTPLIWKAAMDTECGAAYAPIGSFVGERCGYVLDADLNPLPAGVAGELYLGGVGLARGYLQRPGLSAERFVANPFSRAGERLYRTGDLVRQREDGTFDYLGRIDNQVKVRGFRIELGEIEARLQDAGEVREAVVVARDAASGKQLLGYVVAEDGADASGLLERLRERLKRDLPEYMVPAHMALLPAMPLTPNGKIDRKALPDIDVTASEAYVAPRNELELALAGIWQEVLGIARIGVHDNFFELGGDSILSMQVVAKARALKKLGFSLKLRDLIQKPSIAALSGYDDSAAPPSPILALNAAVDGCPPLFCVHAGFGTVFDYEPLARRLNGRRSVLAIQARSLLDPNWRDASLQRMAEDYVALIRQRQAEGPYHLLGWSLGGTLGMLMAAELERQGQQVAFLGLLDSYVPGTEAPAADDWREDLLDFLSVSAGLETRPPLAAGLEQRDNVSAAIAECLGVGQTGKGGLGCDELAQVFLVARQLKQLSGQLDSCSPIQVRPLCWWTRGRGEEVRALSRQLGGQPLAGRVAACGHFQIPHAQEVLDSLVEALEEIHGSLVYS
ncbi:non-ribosomal peptide synthase/polyketide synthase [Pseudomonas aeruginosa]